MTASDFIVMTTNQPSQPERPSTVTVQSDPLITSSVVTTFRL